MKTVVITGAGGVLCSAFAKEMAKNAAVALLDLNEKAAAAVAEEINAAGGKEHTGRVSSGARFDGREF